MEDRAVGVLGLSLSEMQVRLEANLRAASGTEFSNSTCQQRRCTSCCHGGAGLGHSSKPTIYPLPAAARPLIRIRNPAVSFCAESQSCECAKECDRQKPSRPTVCPTTDRLLSGRSFPPRVFPGQCRDAGPVSVWGCPWKGILTDSGRELTPSLRLYLSLVS
ncbi:hypothetical protein B0T14DRAFT_524805 [Immersiella caudata]|uniref:Uncharacterized protein n=1 Tax=Immersiella caudata TaxID=314043 RepID=A0AA40BXD8_9PEZI|nr:hypothetical protein B0T14DRAFT_524805 [Immersiella caudata]